MIYYPLTPTFRLNHMANAIPIRVNMKFADDKSVEIRNATLKGVVLNAVDNAITNVNFGNFAANVILTAMPGTPNDTTLLTSKAIADYVGAQIVSSGTIGRPTGAIDMATGTADLPPSTNGGEYWYVTGLAANAEGLLGGTFQVTNGDMLIAINPSAGGTGGVVAADYLVQQANTIYATASQYGTVMYEAIPTGGATVDFATALSSNTAITPRGVQYIVHSALQKLLAAGASGTSVRTVSSLTNMTYSYESIDLENVAKESIDVRVFDSNGYLDNLVSITYGETGITVECATPIVDAKIVFTTLVPQYNLDSVLGRSAWFNA